MNHDDKHSGQNLFYKLRTLLLCRCKFIAQTCIHTCTGCLLLTAPCRLVEQPVSPEYLS